MRFEGNVSGAMLAVRRKEVCLSYGFEFQADAGPKASLPTLSRHLPISKERALVLEFSLVGTMLGARSC
jgi:hypothetical protein